MNGLSRNFAVKIAAIVLLGASSPAPAETIKPVFQKDLPDLAGRSFTVVEVDFTAGSKADPHRHGQAFVFAYVLSGAVRSQLEGEPSQIHHAGQSWSEPPGAHHLVTENISPTEPARLLVVFVAKAGEPLKTSDPQ